ncbi:Uncharacterized protein HZ326_11188 [Fusarium oxysporum f. sp. albedinis]|nr:Uncharacterized protein HZ326_11188 [Fusarium oxysporum f. sp. albedinis]
MELATSLKIEGVQDNGMVAGPGRRKVESGGGGDGEGESMGSSISHRSKREVGPEQLHFASVHLAERG